MPETICSACGYAIHSSEGRDHRGDHSTHRADTFRCVELLKAHVARLVEANNIELEKRRAAERESLNGFVVSKIAWSKATFGEGERTQGVLQHIAKELIEIALNPHDLSEWVDVILLAMDGYSRHGGENLMDDLRHKHAINLSRQWGPIGTGPIEHVILTGGAEFAAEREAAEKLAKALEPFELSANMSDAYRVEEETNYIGPGEIAVSDVLAARAALAAYRKAVPCG